jgi:hypothetical protein
VQHSVERSIDFHGTAHIPFVKLKPGVSLQVFDVSRDASDEIIEPQHMMAFGD